VGLSEWCLSTPFAVYASSRRMVPPHLAMVQSKNSKTSHSTHAKSAQKAHTMSASLKKNKTAAADMTSGTTSADLVADPSTSELLDRTRMTTDPWYKSVNTTKLYTNYLKSGKEWLEKWTKEGREGLEEEKEMGEVPRQPRNVLCLLEHLTISAHKHPLCCDS
jgi:hypothetical protein